LPARLSVGLAPGGFGERLQWRWTLSVTRWFDRIEPERWDEAIRMISRDPPLTAEQAARFLDRFGGSMDADLSGAFVDSNDAGSRINALNWLFEKAVTAESWYLDKALDAGIETVLRLLPGTLVVQRQIVEFGALDRNLPECCASVDSGLYGACTAAAIECSAEVLARFQDPAMIRDLAANRRAGIICAIDRTHVRARRAQHLLEDDYLRQAWDDLCTAVRTCVSRSHFLGLGMSV
jgi:hypothetical protein